MTNNEPLNREKLLKLAFLKLASQRQGDELTTDELLKLAFLKFAGPKKKEERRAQQKANIRQKARDRANSERGSSRPVKKQQDAPRPKYRRATAQPAPAVSSQMVSSQVFPLGQLPKGVLPRNVVDNWLHMTPDELNNDVERIRKEFGLNNFKGKHVALHPIYPQNFKVIRNDGLNITRPVGYIPFAHFVDENERGHFNVPRDKPTRKFRRSVPGLSSTFKATRVGKPGSNALTIIPGLGDNVTVTGSSQGASKGPGFWERLGRRASESGQKGWNATKQFGKGIGAKGVAAGKFLGKNKGKAALVAAVLAALHENHGKNTARRELDASNAKIDRLMNRGFFARMFNRDV